MVADDRLPARGAVRYSRGAIALHWLIALALSFQLALGFAMPKDASGFALFQLHKSIGITILLLSLARLGWRLTHRPPAPLEAGWEGALANTVHIALYIFMIGAPLTGWALVSTAPVRVPTLLFGAIELPHLPLPSAIHEGVESAHLLLAWLALGLIALHLAGALRHQILLKRDILGRMAPLGSARIASLLGLLVVGIYFGSGAYIAGRFPVPFENAANGESQPLSRLGGSDNLSRADDENEALAAASEPPSAPSQAIDANSRPVWIIQPGGRLGFTVGNGEETLSGSFSQWNGNIRFDPEAPQRADITVTVQLGSATLGDPTLDAMLQGADFLGGSGPSATWRSTSVRRVGPGRYAAQGTLSLKGVTRPQRLAFALTGSGPSRSVEGTATIERAAFGVGAGDTAKALDEQVRLSFAFDATARQP